MRSKLLAAAVAAVLSLPLAACGGSADSSGSADSEKLTITIAEYGEGTKSLVEAAGVFDDAPYNVEFAHFPTGTAMLAAVASDRLDLANVGGLPPIVASSSGMKLKLIVAMTTRNPEISEDNMLVAEDSEITDPTQLRGKTIGVPKGTAAHALAMNVLTKNGMTPDDVTFAFLEPAQLASALSSGKIDAAAAYEPYGSAILAAGGRVLVPGIPPDYPSFTFFATSTKVLDDPERREAVTDTVRRLSEAYDWAVDNVDAHVEAIAKDSGMSVEDSRDVVEIRQLKFIPIDEQIIDVYQQTADNFYEVGEIDQPVDFASTVENVLN
jgi:sulfonate transport system substrate-binding protein